MKFMAGVPEQATMLIIAQLNHDAKIAVELTLPITTDLSI